MNARGDRIAWSAPAYDSVEFSTFDDAERVANAERDNGDGAAAATAAGSNVSQGLPHCSLCKANSICRMSRVMRHTSHVMHHCTCIKINSVNTPAISNQQRSGGRYVPEEEQRLIRKRGDVVRGGTVPSSTTKVQHSKTITQLHDV